MSRTHRHDNSGPLDILRLGLLVLGSELRWIVLRGLRELEIRQMRKRLNQEYLTLGRCAERMSLTDAGTAEAEQLQRDNALSLGQVAFLKQEIALLEKERERSRGEYVRRRVSNWNLDVEQD